MRRRNQLQEFAMAVLDRVAALKARHNELEDRLDEELGRPVPDDAAVHDLKRRKLRLKDEMSRLGA